MFLLPLQCVSSTAVPQETGFKENDICPFTLIVGLEGSNKPYCKINFSDLKGPCCIPVMRIKYCISPKSYYTVMNIPSLCEEPGGGSLWCLPYWWAIILLRGSVWTRSQEAQIFPCSAPPRSPAIPPEQHPPQWSPPKQIPLHTTLSGNWGSSSSFKRCLSTCGIRLRAVKPQKSEVTSVVAFLQTTLCMFRNQGCSIFSQALWVFLSHHVILIHVLHLVIFTSNPRKLKNTDLMLGATPQDIQGDDSSKRYVYSPSPF